MMKCSALKALAVAVVVALGAEGASAERVLKLGTVGRPGVPIGDAIEQALIPKAAEVSGGKLTVEPHYRGSLCGEQKCGEQANQGLLQLWTSSTANFGNFGTALSIFDLPYLFKSLDAADEVAAGWLSDAQCKVAAETTGHICFVVYASGGFRHLGNAVRPVHVPDDMKGVKFRVTKSPIEYTLIKSWGAVPIPYDWTQLYQGLQTGVVEGQYVSIPWQHLSKLHEVAKYYTRIGGAWSGNQISMDLGQYEKLSADEKEWIRAAAAEFGESVRRLDQEWVKDGIDAIRKDIKEWYEPSEEEMALWRQGPWEPGRTPRAPMTRRSPSGLWPNRVSTASSLPSRTPALCRPEWFGSFAVSARTPAAFPPGNDRGGDQRSGTRSPDVPGCEVTP